MTCIYTYQQYQEDPLRYAEAALDAVPSLSLFIHGTQGLFFIFYLAHLYCFYDMLAFRKAADDGGRYLSWS